MSGGPAREVLDVVDVMARYGLRDRRAARRLMDEAGAFMVGGRLVLRREDLLGVRGGPQGRTEACCAWRGGRTLPAAPTTASREPAVAGPPPPEPLRPGWWRRVA